MEDGLMWKRPPDPRLAAAARAAPVTPGGIYLFQQAGVDPSRWSAEEVLARSSRRLREMVARWWEQLEPEETGGIPVAIMEQTLARVAQTAVKLPHQRVGRKWVQFRLHLKFKVAAP